MALKRKRRSVYCGSGVFKKDAQSEEQCINNVHDSHPRNIVNNYFHVIWSLVETL